MKRTDFKFDSRDGKSKIHGVKWEPDTEPKAVVILVHGMAEHLNRYEAFAKFLCDNGFVVAGNEHLGHGGSVGENPKGYFCHRDPATVVVRDVHRLKKTIQSEYPTLPVFIFGHSMGSLITRNYLTRYGTGVKGAVISGTLMTPKSLLGVMKVLIAMLTFFQGEKHPSVLLNTLAFSAYNKRIPDAKTPFDWLTRDEDIVNKYISDLYCGFLFTVNGFETLRELSKRLYDKSLLEKIPKDFPVMFIYGGEDPTGEYGAGVKRVIDQYRELGIKDITDKCYPEDRHELLNELNKEQVMQDVLEWFEGHI